ncbi:hypothetical protein BVRB_3g057970 [Beta vulgaris subsp. vulgaris]|nr:hypothetical protein BVRB_3g057970 [Beta vulgaris subsp. vulgaris]
MEKCMGRSRIFLIATLVLFIALSGVTSSVGATRLLPEDLSNLASNNHVQFYATTKFTMFHWLQRLASGPSDGGGH